MNTPEVSKEIVRHAIVACLQTFRNHETWTILELISQTRFLFKNTSLWRLVLRVNNVYNYDYNAFAVGIVVLCELCDFLFSPLFFF